MRIIIHDAGHGVGSIEPADWIVHGLNPALCPNCAGHAPGSTITRIGGPLASGEAGQAVGEDVVVLEPPPAGDAVSVEPSPIDRPL